MEKFLEFKTDLKSVFGGKLITRKEYGPMHYANGGTYNGVYLCQYNTETGQYRYWDILGNSLIC